MASGLLFADAATRTSYELSRLQSYTERWHYLVLVVVCAAIVAFAVWMYRRDSVELRPGVGGLLLALRLAALVERWPSICTWKNAPSAKLCTTRASC